MSVHICEKCGLKYDNESGLHICPKVKPVEEVKTVEKVESISVK